ncbi:MAG TPA: bifunctional 4-hydroxy-2-oxoglutarate aldolase/2-dehydro-3-deoxy-phosphogluconate aldolase [Lacunisphaera sp.]|nr:bifunctional 4-hydroxy-2-oxoglutarate aldolase/2-dehydro-3-deoxy-phosphogluconate aldolase [Lacunisphaera sp.]
MILKKTMNAAEVIERSRVVSIIRMDDLESVCDIAGALYRGGVRCFEIPLTAANAGEIITELGQRLPDDAAIGAGTVLTGANAGKIIDAGACFIVSPHFVPEVAAVCKTRGVAHIPGAFSPQEIYQAWTSGAALVKVFSIRPLGPEYLGDILGPYPEIKLMPTGGINVNNAASFLKAGARAVTIGRDIIGNGPWDAAALEQMVGRAEKLMADIRLLKSR